MHIKTAMRYHLTPVKMVIIKKPKFNKWFFVGVNVSELQMLPLERKNTSEILTLQTQSCKITINEYHA